MFIFCTEGVSALLTRFTPEIVRDRFHLDIGVKCGHFISVFIELFYVANAL